jgi:FMN reductase
VAYQVAALFEEPEDVEYDVVELGEIAAELFDRSSSHVAALAARVSTASVVVVVSPVVKGTYTALVKAFLEWFDRTSLQHVVVVPVMVGAAPHHALAVEAYLRPVLVELGGIAPTRGLYVMKDQLGELSPIVARWIAESSHVIRRVALKDRAQWASR